METLSPLFELQHVSKQFEDFNALHDINLTIFAGECVALVGPSGAGKTTLLNLLNGTLKPDKGELYLLGQPIDRLRLGELRHLQQQIGTIYQQFHLINNLRVIHNINAGHLGRWPLWKALFSLIWPLEVEMAHHILTQVGIPDKLYERTDRLSGGEQQRVAIARVLAQNPQAILADEPVASLDPERSREVMDVLRGVTQYLGKTLVVTLHTMAFAYSHCSRIVGLRGGRIMFDAPPSAITPQMVERLYHIG